MKKSGLGFCMLLTGILLLGLAGCNRDTETVETLETLEPGVPENQIEEGTPQEDEADEEGLTVQFTQRVVLDAATVMSPYEQELIDHYMQFTPFQGDEPWTDDQAWEYLISIHDWYDAGTVEEANHAYDGWKLVVLNQECEGPCFSPMLFRYLWNLENGELVTLTAYLPENTEGYVTPVIEKTEAVQIAELRLPETVDLPEGKGVLTKTMDDARYDTIDEVNNAMNGKELEFTDEKVGNVYRSETASCFYVVAPDGSIARYELIPEFFKNLYETNTDTSITWDDGTRQDFTADYQYTPSGCGISGNCYLIESINAEEVNAVGILDDGTVIYEAKAPYEGASEENGANLAQIKLANAYQEYVTMQNMKIEYEGSIDPILSFEQYVEKHPLVYWQDVLGRWSSLVQNDYRPAVECGKPVIYLYPTETMDVNVQVDVAEFTKTEPEYGKAGWTVRATPTGTLYNYADGENYPYLFWEAHSTERVTVDQGFVMTRTEVPEFLDNALDTMGFLAQEKKDFLEFWQPKIMIQPEPYVFISFLGTEAFNAVAPLTITPAPDTLIRVFMMFEPLNEPFAVEPQHLSKKSRRGFTVFEWGGTSSRPWAKE